MERARKQLLTTLFMPTALCAMHGKQYTHDTKEEEIPTMRTLYVYWHTHYDTASCCTTDNYDSAFKDAEILLRIAEKHQALIKNRNHKE